MIDLEPVEVEVAARLRVLVLRAASADQVLHAAVTGNVDPYAAVLWPAALACARELPGRVRAGERVLDLGAGTGLCALTAARLGAISRALDHDAAARAAIAQAAALQRLDVEVLAFDVTGPEPLPPGELAILADVLYQPDLARAAAARTLEMLRRGDRVLVGDPGRGGRTAYLEILAAAGIAVEFAQRTVRVPGEASESTVGVAWIGTSPGGRESEDDGGGAG